MEKEQEMALTQMRKSVEKLGSSTEKFGDSNLMRFLIVRSMDPSKAAKMFVQWQKWRSTMVPNGFIAESEIQEELEPRKAFLQGLSKEGFPLLILQARKHFPSKDSNQYKKFVIYMVDKTIASSIRGREIGNEKFVGIFDLQQIAYKNIDTRGMISAFQILQAYYPDRLAKLYFLHMPGFFVSVWKMVSRFLEKALLEKVMIVKNDEEMKGLIKEIGEDALPEEYGGRAKLVALQDVTLPPLDTASPSTSKAAC